MSLQSNLSKITRLYKSYIEDIIRCVPEQTELVGPILDNLTSDNQIQNMTEINNLAKCLLPYSVRIQQKDETLIMNDNIDVVPGVKLREYWGEMSEQTKNALWKYLQVFVLWAVKLQQERNSLSEQTASNIVEQIASGLNDLSGNPDLSGFNMDELMTRLREENIENGEGIGEGMDMNAILSIMNTMKNGGGAGLGGLFDEKTMDEMKDMVENSKIGGVARDIMKNVDVSGLAKEFGLDKIKDEKDINMAKMMKKIMNPKNQNTMKNMFGNIGKTIQNKVQSGELKTDELMQEAMGFMQKLGKTNNPMMKMATNMFNQQMGKSKVADRLRRKYDKIQKEREEQRENQNQDVQPQRNMNIESFPDNPDIAENIENVQHKKKSRGRRGGKKHKNKNKQD
jgi:hypothetical protein